MSYCEIPLSQVCQAVSAVSGGPVEDLNGIPIPADLLTLDLTPARLLKETLLCVKQETPIKGESTWLTR
jgi:hypothetical protein